MTTISLTKVLAKVLRSDNSLSFRNSPMSCARRHDGLQVVLDRLALGENGLSLLQRCLKKASPLSVGLDPDIRVGRDVVGGLHDIPEPAQPTTYVRKLRLDGLQPPTLFADQAFQLFGNDLRQIADDGFSEYAGANPPDDQLLEAAGVEPGGIAAILAPL